MACSVCRSKKCTRSIKVGDKLIQRLVVDFHRRPNLLDEAVVHDDDAIAHGHRFHLVVRHVNHGGVETFVEFDEFGAHIDAQFGIEIT